MSGHSKWATIKRHKAKMDAARSGVISKALRDVMLAARHGGGNPDANLRLKIAIERARASNVTNDSIARAIKRGSGEGEGGQVEELTYECYGPGGTAILVEAATDNRNRTAGEIRFILSKHGGKLAEMGAVAWMFDQKGLITLAKGDLSDDDALLLAIDAGADDMETEEEAYLVYTAPNEVFEVSQRLIKEGATVENAELTQVPKSTVALEPEDLQKMIRLIDALDEHDDVAKVHFNFDTSDEAMASLPE